MANSGSSGSLTETAYRKLRDDIVTCRLRPGQRLITADLCKSLDVSLGAVREALSRLSSEGLVVAEPQRGSRVAQISKDELQDLTAVRLQVECMCLERAISRGDLAWEGRLMAAYHEMSRVSQMQETDKSQLSEEWARAHAHFHAVLVDPCGSAWLLRLRELLFTQSDRYRRYKFLSQPTDRDTRREHRDIMQAAIRRDVPKATALLTEHLKRTARIVTRELARNEAAIWVKAIGSKDEGRHRTLVQRRAEAPHRGGKDIHRTSLRP